MQVRLEEGTKPISCSSRRYSSVHREFLQRHTATLHDAGLIRRNPNSAWMSPPFLVKKANGDYRMTVDLRGVNMVTVTPQWPMPILEVAFDKLTGAKYFFTIDFFKGYWQFPLHSDSQECMSFCTDTDVWTPNRVLQGSAGAVSYFQSSVQHIMGPLFNNGILIWLDDILGYHDSIDGLLQLLENLLQRCTDYGLKLNPNKCKVFSTSIVWCGRLISPAGITFQPSRISALTSMSSPQTGADLQQFLCAMNWMRSAIPDFNRVIAPLHDLLETIYCTVGGRKRNQVSAFRLQGESWTDVHQQAFQTCKEALANIVTLTHLDLTKVTCVFTDASEYHWGAVVTQIPGDDLRLPIHDQQHAPIAFLSGSFKGSALHWAIIEKEAFAIVETCVRMAHVLQCATNLRIFTDHRNLIFLFDPCSTNSAFARHTIAKLQRWAMQLLNFQYCIEHIAGETNVWADLLSRWGGPPIARARINRVYTLPPSPITSNDFEWPNAKSIQMSQNEALVKMSESFIVENKLQQNESLLWSFPDMSIWIPDNDYKLQLRLCIISHSGTAGHRGQDATEQALKKRYKWNGLSEQIRLFVRKCLLCRMNNEGRMEPRPYGEAIHATGNNEVLHFDYLYMDACEKDKLKWLLVLKDDFSGFLELVPCARANSESAVSALLDWFKRYGRVNIWVTDCGSHFRNNLV